MQSDSDSKASQTTFLHIDLSNMRDLIGDAPDAELRLAELGLSLTRRQTAELLAAAEAGDFAAALSSVRALGNTMAAFNAERALSILKAVELFASRQDIAELKICAEQLAVENALVCTNLAGQVARLKSRAM